MAKITRAISYALAIILMLLLPSAWCEDMETHRATYEIHLEEIMLDHSKKLNELPKQYAAALVALKAKFQKEGSLTKIKRILAEMERFEKTKAMPEGKRLGGLQEIRNLQAAYSKHVIRLEKNRATAIISSTTQYDRALDNYQKTLVKAGKFDDAVKVEEERKRAKENAIYFRAKLTLSRYEKETVAPAIVNLANPGRPIDAKRFEGHWYKIYPGNVNWGAAKKRCEELGGYLACVETEKERKWLANLKKNKVLWVGGHDEKEEGKLRWINGKRVSLETSRNSKSYDYIALNAPGKLQFRPNHGLTPEIPQKLVHGFICEWEK